MNGIILIDKPKNHTSRDVVNILGKKLKTKKIGHTGTLDPIATGLLVICVGKYTKLVDLLTSYEKEYIATVVVGIETDTLDVTGNILKEEKNIKLDDNILRKALNNFKGKYSQEVPIYSAVKINGKKLYEYAREGRTINLPKREVEIKNIELIDNLKYTDNKLTFSFKVLVSKGTYIRSLIKDIGDYLNIPMTMKELRRTKQGNFDIENCNHIDDENYKILNINQVFDYPIIKIDNEILKKKILNGSKIDNTYNKDIIMFELDDEVIALYKASDDKLVMKPYKMLL